MATPRHLIAPLALAGSAAPAAAQSDFQQWLTASARVDVAGDLSLQNELIARFSDDRGGLYEIEAVALLGYQLSKNVTAAAGYVYNPNYASGALTSMEHRAREQVTIDNVATFGRASLSARVRLEQRWREGIRGTAWRIRPYAKVAVPLGDSGTPTLNLTAESFVNLNNTAFQGVDGLERLRSAISLTLPVSKAIKLETGYLNQHRFVRGGPDTDDHVITASLAFTF